MNGASLISKLITLTAFGLSAAVASSQVIAPVYGSGSMQEFTGSQVWGQVRIWQGGSGRGGHGRWVWVWRTKSLESVSKTAPLDLNSLVAVTSVKGSALGGSYGASMGGATSFTDNGTVATFKLAFQDATSFAPLLGPYNNCTVSTAMKYVFYFNAVNPVQLTLTGAGNASVQIVGANADASMYPINGTLSTILDPDTYSVTITTDSFIFADKYTKTNYSYGPATEALNLKMVFTTSN